MARASNSTAVLALIKKVWPHHGVSKGGKERLVPCPFCTTDKLKCSINPEKGVFQCWVCRERGPVFKLLFHLVDLKVIKKEDVEAIRSGEATFSSKIEALKQSRKKEHSQDILWSENVPCVFPDGVELILSGKLTGIKQIAVDYLINRGLNSEIIKRYSLAVCTKPPESGGRYSGHIFFPIFDIKGKMMVYWSTRTISPTSFPKSFHANEKYTRYKASQVLWNCHRLEPNKPFLLCEGPIDALSADFKNLPSSALLGKVIHPYQISMINSVRPKPLYIMLDGGERSSAFGIAKKLSLPDIRIVDLPEGEDPNSVSRDVLMEKIRGAKDAFDPLVELSYTPHWELEGKILDLYD